MPLMFEAAPFEYVQPAIPLPVVEGRIGDDDRPIRIAIDTGGGGPVGIYIAEALGALPGAQLGSAELMPTPFGGQPVRLRTGTVTRVTIAGETLTNAAIAQSDLVDRLASQVGAPVDAVVGHNFFANRIVSFDFQHRQVDFSAPPGAQDGVIPVRFTPQRRHLLVDGWVNGEGPFVFLVDTGSMRSYVSPDIAARVRLPISGETIVRGAGGETRAPTGQANVRVGSRDLTLRALLVSAELDQMSARYGTRVDGILGIDWMLHTRITIDYGGGRMWVATAQPSTGATPVQ